MGVNYRAGAGIGFEILEPEVQQVFESFGQKPSVKTQKTVVNKRVKSPAKVAEAPTLHSLYSAPPPEQTVKVSAPDTLYGDPAEDLPSYVEAPSYQEEATTPVMLMDPSYYFQYSGPDSERTEDADTTGAVVGSYSYTSPGGQQIVVRYRAGADTGFVIDNQEELDAALLEAASEPFTAVAPTDEHEFNLDTDEADVLPTSQSSPSSLQSLYSAPPTEVSELPTIEVSAPDTLYGAPAEDLPSYVELPPPSYEAEVAPAPMMMMMYPSYNFAYTGEAGTREEAADSQGVVTGQYSYLSPEGREIVVRYHAGAETGFAIENEEELAASVREATDAGAEAAAARVVAAPALPILAPQDTYRAASDEVIISVPDTLYGAPSAPELPSYSEPEAVPQMIMDASFNFAVDEDDHTFQEEADISGERTGSYSYMSPEGKMVRVRYTAGRKGFVILNPEEVLPQATV